MTRHTRSALALTLTLSAAAGLSAQERVGASNAPEANGAPGWTFTPSFGYVGTYDDNISLSATNREDYIGRPTGMITAVADDRAIEVMTRLADK